MRPPCGTHSGGATGLTRSCPWAASVGMNTDKVAPHFPTMSRDPQARPLRLTGGSSFDSGARQVRLGECDARIRRTSGLYSRGRRPIRLASLARLRSASPMQLPAVLFLEHHLGQIGWPDPPRQGCPTVHFRGPKTRPYSGRCFGSADGGQGGAKSRPSHTGANGKFTFGRPAWAACGTKSEAEIWPQFLSRELAPLGRFSGNPVSTFWATWERNFASAGAPFWRTRVSHCEGPVLAGPAQLALLCRLVVAIGRRSRRHYDIGPGLPQTALALQPLHALQHISANVVLPSAYAPLQSPTSQAVRREREHCSKPSHPP